SHVDQLTFIFRFVNSGGQIVERFIGFEPLENHTGASLADFVLVMANNLGLDILNCRGQSYDNASKINGLQAHLTRVNPLTHYVPCAAHSLNLVGVNSINNSCLNAINFFCLLQSLYAFCSVSTYRWKRLFSNADSVDKQTLLTLKSLSDTRWSSHADSTKALCKNYDRIRQALEDLSKNMNQSPDTQLEAASLQSKMEQLEMAFLAQFWDTVLQQLKMTSIQLQKMDINLSTAVHLLRSLESFVAVLRDQFENFEYATKNTCKAVSQKYQSDLCCTRKRKQFVESREPETLLEGSQKFCIETFYVIIDKLLACLHHRLDAYKMLYDHFRGLFELSSLDVTNIIICKRVAELAAVYPQDLDQNFPDELMQFQHFVQDEPDKSPTKLLQVLRHNGLQSTFPNVDIALRIFLTLPVTNCEGEHTFSKMARKNELRSTMHQRHLNALSLMPVESELGRQMDFDDLICDFSSLKARKKPTV
uniref:HAT C-terminal dimerisation domain-containing protein n=1 Tax=Latimeria chalumnae TaxID=7897 RepID=H3A1C2_LATCH